MSRGGGESPSSNNRSFSGGGASRGFSGGAGGSSTGRGGGSVSQPSRPSQPARTYSQPSYNPPPVSRPRPSYTPSYSRSYDRYDRYHRPRRTYQSNTTLLDSCISWLIVGFVVVCIMLYFMPHLITNIGGTGGSSSAVVNEVQREKIDSSALNKVNVWVEDNAKWLNQKSKVESAMKYFMDKTGIQPYLMINEEINGQKTFTDSDVEKLLEATYNQQFNDEAHMILLFVEPVKNQYSRYIYSGTVANTLMDSNAQKVMYKYIDSYYTNSNLTDDEYFSTIFTKTADTIMAKVTTKNDVAKSNNIKMIVFILVAGGIQFFVIRRKMKIKELEKAKEILDKEI